MANVKKKPKTDNLSKRQQLAKAFYEFKHHGNSNFSKNFQEKLVHYPEA